MIYFLVSFPDLKILSDTRTLTERPGLAYRAPEASANASSSISLSTPKFSAPYTQAPSSKPLGLCVLGLLTVPHFFFFLHSAQFGLNPNHLLSLSEDLHQEALLIFSTGVRAPRRSHATLHGTPLCPLTTLLHKLFTDSKIMNLSHLSLRPKCLTLPGTYLFVCQMDEGGDSSL